MLTCTPNPYTYFHLEIRYNATELYEWKEGKEEEQKLKVRNMRAVVNASVCLLR